MAISIPFLCFYVDWTRPWTRFTRSLVSVSKKNKKHAAFFKLRTMCVFIFRKEKKRLRATAVLVNLSRFTLSHTFLFCKQRKKKASCLLPQMSVFRNVQKKKSSRIKPRTQKKSLQMPALCYHMLRREAGFGRLRHCIKQCIIYKWIIINEAKVKESRRLQTNQ